MATLTKSNAPKNKPPSFPSFSDIFNPGRTALFIIALVFAIAFIVAAASGAFAADLGGNCCADLEERIAELEASTAKKGNKKVSLTISGWVAEQVMWWNDGTDSATYIGGVGRTLATHVKFTGEARINPDVSAGFVMHIEVLSNDPLAWNQDGTGASGGVEALQTYWFVKSKQVGKISIGKQSTASDNAAITVDGSGSLVPANWVLFDGAGFFLRSNGVRLDQAAANAFGPGVGFTSQRSLGWGNELGFCNSLNAGTGGDCAGVPLNAIRYDSPTWNGFSASAAWAQGDFWDVAARYSTEYQQFRLAGIVAYSSSTSTNGASSGDSKYLQAGAYVEHIPTGLWFYGAYGNERNSGVNVVNAAFVVDPPGPIGPITIFPFSLPSQAIDSNNWYVKGGVRERWTSFGHTVVYGEYGQHNDQLGPELRLLGADSSKLTQYGFGVVQEIDAAAMSIWLKYRHMDGEADCAAKTICGGGPGSKLSFDAIDFAGFGAIINY